MSGYYDETITVELQANSTYIIALGVYDREEDALSVTLSFTAQNLPDEGEFEKPFKINDYSDSDITCEYPGGNDPELFVWYKYTAYKTGTLTLTMGGRAVVKYGMDADNLETATNQQTITFAIEAYEAYYIAVQSSDLSAGNVEFSFVSEYLLGSVDRPIEIADITAEQNCNYAGSDVWFTFAGGEEGGYVTLSSAYATAKLGGGNSTYSVIYNDSVSYGNVRFYVDAWETAYIVVGDWAENDSAEIAFTISFEAGEHELDGSYKYPYEATIGNGICNFAGGWSYIWYALTIDETGTVVVSSDNANAAFVISPTTSAYAEGAKEGIGSVSYGSPAGVCYIGIKADDSSACEIAYTISFEAGELQADGSSTLPFAAVIGENTCSFPGGWSPVWYVITVDAPAIITVSSDYVSSAASHGWGCSGSDCAWIVVAPEADTYSPNGVSNAAVVGSDVVFEATQAGTYYIAIADWCEAAGEIVFNVSVVNS